MSGGMFDYKDMQLDEIIMEKQRNCKCCGKDLNERGSDNDLEYCDGYCTECYDVPQYQCILCKTEGTIHPFRGTSEDGSYLKCFMCGSRSIIKLEVRHSSQV
jgi:DNA-directed RNA polymerase subunit RPC12/RpoP